jgi:hypothetical protein
MVENPTKYDWIQASVFVHWDILANQQRVFFVDVPHDKQKQIQESFPSWDMRDRNPWIWHAVFGHAMKYLYDESIWRLRHVVRGVEKVSSLSQFSLLQRGFVNSGHRKD